MICGPTAVGKTAAAMAVAMELHTEILSADSMQIYRGLDIGSAKPSADERREVPHFLIDIADPKETYSVAQYREDFDRCIAERFADRVPVVCGGTGLYFNAILYEYDFGGAHDDGTVRARLKARSEAEGREALFEELRRIDPVTASQLSPNDEKRVIRALEIYQLTGRKKSDFSPRLTNRYDFTVIGLQRERQVLYQMINSRVLCMIRDGLIEEVEGLLAAGVRQDAQCMQAIGYKEIVEYLSGRCSREEAIARIQQATRNYAKRQITWFKRLPGIHWLDADEGGIAGKILSRYAADEERLQNRLS